MHELKLLSEFLRLYFDNVFIAWRTRSNILFKQGLKEGRERFFPCPSKSDLDSSSGRLAAELYPHCKTTGWENDFELDNLKYFGDSKNGRTPLIWRSRVIEVIAKRKSISLIQALLSPTQSLPNRPIRLRYLSLRLFTKNQLKTNSNMYNELYLFVLEYLKIEIN